MSVWKLCSTNNPQRVNKSSAVGDSNATLEERGKRRACLWARFPYLPFAELPRENPSHRDATPQNEHQQLVMATEAALSSLSSPVENRDRLYLAQPLTAPVRGCQHRGGPKCVFRMFWGGRALLAPVEMLEFTRKQWILKIPGRQSFALLE